MSRPAFDERRIHRFINSHKTYLLPSFQECYYEHELVLKEEKRVADFILRIGTGFPALLIELENPSHPVFKKNNDLTYQTNHAISQINEWISFIDRDQRNVSGDFEFLAGPKSRLVIIGRGLEKIHLMKESVYSRVAVWTYDLLILEAVNRWNQVISEQCKYIGITSPNLLKAPSS